MCQRGQCGLLWTASESMNTIETILQALMGAATLILAGLMGAVLNIGIVRPTDWIESITTLGAGVVFAVFIAPFTVSFLPLIESGDPEATAAFGVLYGLIGILLSQTIIKTVRNVGDGDKLSEAVRSALISIITKGAPDEPD